MLKKYAVKVSVLAFSPLCPLFPFSLPFFLFFTFFFYPFFPKHDFFLYFPNPRKGYILENIYPCVGIFVYDNNKIPISLVELFDFQGLKKLARLSFFSNGFSHYSKVGKFKHFLFLPYIAYACIFQQQLKFLNL